MPLSLKKSPLKRDSEEEKPTYSIKVSAEAVAAVPIKLEEVFDCPGTSEDADDDGISY